MAPLHGRSENRAQHIVNVINGLGRVSFLRSRGHSAIAYSAKMEDAERRAAEVDLINNDVKALVATSALGMGFDKPDLAFVVHLGAPPSPIAYYQQIGRAGRAVRNARVILLPGAEDVAIWRYFWAFSFPPEDQVRIVLEILAANGTPVSVQALEPRVDLSRGRLEHMLKVLDVDGAVRRVAGGWVATGATWRHDSDRYERIAAARRAEQDSMLQYETTAECRMEFLRRCLDDPGAASCQRCDNCAGLFVSVDISSAALDAARSHLNRVGVEITPRTQWPTGLLAIGVPLSGRIAVGERALSGRAVARLAEVGWGERLRPLLDEGTTDAPAPDSVLRAAIQVLDDWAHVDDLRPVGVVAMGSRRRPTLIGSLADRISDACGLPRLGTLSAVGSEHGAGRANSARRVAALHSEFTLDFIIPMSEWHVRPILREWVGHYNRGRSHASLGPGIPEGSIVAPVVRESNGRSVPARCRVAATPILSGLHHEYRLERHAA